MQANLPVPATTRLQRAGFALSVAQGVRQRGGSVTLAARAFRMVWGSGNGGGMAGTMTAYSESLSRYGGIGTLPGSSIDYAREVGDPCHNAVVSIALGFIGTQLAEPVFQVTRRRRDGSEEAIPGHPLTQLLQRPGPQGDGVKLLAAVASDLKVAGNGYLLKYRGAGGAGKPVQLAHVPYWELAPRWPTDGSQFITDYLYRPSARGAGVPVDPANVIHFKGALNPYNQGRTGRAPLYPLLREVFADNESAEYEAAIVANMGIPGGMLTSEVADAPAIPKEQREELVDLWVDKFTGSGRGSVLVPSLPLKYTKVGQSPAELGIAALRDRPEDRICAALQLSAMVLNLTAGANAKTYANFDAALKAAYDNCILPLLQDLARTLTEQLLPDFSPGPSERCGWDTSAIACLSEDQTELYNRVNSAVAAGWLRVDQARRLAGVESDDAVFEESCAVFLLGKGVTPVADLTTAATQAHEAGELGNEGAAAATAALTDPDTDDEEDEESSGG